MGKIGNAVGRIGTFVVEVKGELKKSSWPTKSELVGHTTVIIITVLMLGAFVGASDWVLRFLVKLLAS